jgi:ferredoxin
MELRPGEMVVQCAGGKCVSCKQRIEPGPAVQLSARTSAIRHPQCMPKKDKRHYLNRFEPRRS